MIARGTGAITTFAGSARVRAVRTGAGCALVVVSLVLTMGMAIVKVVDVVFVDHSGVATAGTVSVVVALGE